MKDRVHELELTVKKLLKLIKTLTKRIEKLEAMVKFHEQVRRR